MVWGMEIVRYREEYLRVVEAEAREDSGADCEAHVFKIRELILFQRQQRANVWVCFKPRVAL